MRLPLQQRPKRLSYPNQLAVFQYLSFGNRLSLTPFKNSLPKALQQITSSKATSSMKVQLTASYEDFNDIYTGSIHVDTVEYTFRYVASSGEVEIRCSLKPENAVFSSEWMAAKYYFGYFVRHLNVSHLEIGYCPFHFYGIRNLKIPFLKWTTPRLKYPPSFLTHFSRSHVFERLELCGQDFESLINRHQLSRAKHLVLGRTIISVAEETAVAEYLLWNPPIETLQFTQSLCSVATFLKCCEIILRRNLKIGSFITGIFDSVTSMRDDVFREVAERFMSCAVIDTFENKKCVVLAKENDYITAVFHNYNEPKSETKESFTVIKLALLAVQDTYPLLVMTPVTKKKPFSYPVLEILLPVLPLEMRIKVARRCPELRSLDKRLPFKIRTLRCPYDGAVELDEVRFFAAKSLNSVFDLKIWLADGRVGRRLVDMDEPPPTQVTTLKSELTVSEVIKSICTFFLERPGSAVDRLVWGPTDSTPESVGIPLKAKIVELRGRRNSMQNITDSLRAEARMLKLNFSITFLQMRDVLRLVDSSKRPIGSTIQFSGDGNVYKFPVYFLLDALKLKKTGAKRGLDVSEGVESPKPCVFFEMEHADFVVYLPIHIHRFNYPIREIVTFKVVAKNLIKKCAQEDWPQLVGYP